MYLSRLIFNMDNLEAIRALGNYYELHQTLLLAFPHRENGGSGRVLFRVESQRSIPAPMALVQSELEPNWTSLGSIITHTEYRSYTPVLMAGQELRFRLRANPTKRVDAKRVGDKLAGKRVQIFGEDEQLDWLHRKSITAGFTLIDSRISAVERQICRKYNKNIQLVYQAVTYDGQMHVTDPESLLLALQHGIGSAKGFGFGLLSLARRG